MSHNTIIQITYASYLQNKHRGRIKECLLPASNEIINFYMTLNNYVIPGNSQFYYSSKRYYVVDTVNRTVYAINKKLATEQYDKQGN